MAAVVLLSAVSPSKLAGELELFGHTVWEALALSEVLYLCEQRSIDAVIIAAEVEQGELIEKQLRGIVMRLEKKADATYVDWELSRLFAKNQNHDSVTKGSVLQPINRFHATTRLE